MLSVRMRGTGLQGQLRVMHDAETTKYGHAVRQRYMAKTHNTLKSVLAKR